MCKGMILKFLRPVAFLPNKVLLKHTVNVPNLIQQRSRPMFGLVPPSQYDTPLSRRFHLMYVLTVYWETVPLFVTTAVALSVCIFSIIWATRNKVDVVFSTHSRRNISRTMDLRNPSTHKIIIINQRYEPWPEMQAVLDKMVEAEKRALVRMESCAHA